MTIRMFILALMAMAWQLSSTSCTPTEGHPLSNLKTISMSIGGEPFELWIADDEQKSSRGLMYITTEQMAPLSDGTRRGMIFVRDHEQHLSFWMKNTIIPLDIAFLDTSGRITAIHTMAPLDDRYGQYNSNEPARFAIEVNAKVYSQLGVKTGDTIDIPASVLKRAP